jgi:hypothetical protein
MTRRPPRIRWSAPEQRVCRQHARLLQQGKFRNASHATLSAEHEIAQLHRKHPGERWACVCRTHDAVLRQILKWVRASRWKWPHAPWSPEENEVLDRYARGIVRQRSANVTRTAEVCWEELERRHRRNQQRVPPRLKTPQPRSYRAVLGQVRTRSLAMGRTKRQKIWTSAEMAIGLKWWRKLPRTRGQYGRLSLSDASGCMMTELKRDGFDRTQAACVGKIRELCMGIRRRTATPAPRTAGSGPGGN